MKDFAYYKNWALNHLKKQFKSEIAVTKSFAYCEMMLEKSFPVGTVREWKGKKYKKVAPGKWMRYYERQNRGSAQALRYAISQLEKIEDMETLAKFVNANRNRFCDEHGKPLPEAVEILRMGKEKAGGIKAASEKEKYQKLQEEFIEEIRTGKRDNTRELQEDVNFWKHLIKTGAYSGAHLEHIKKVVEIGEEELKKRKRKSAAKEKKAETSNTEKSVKTECKSIAELKDYAKENYNIDILYNSNAKTDEEQCINSFYEVEKMCKKLPGLNEYIKAIEYINLGKRNNGLYRPDSYKIEIGNFQKNKEFEDFKFATGQDVVTVMQHEMVHAIQTYIFENHDEEDFKDMFENSRLGDKYIKHYRGRYKTMEEYKENHPESFIAHKYKFYQNKICKDIMKRAFGNLGMKPVKFGDKTELSYYVEKNPETGIYRLGKSRFTPAELAAAKISFYSLSDPTELWSEAFTDYLQNGDNAQPLSKEIWKIVNEDYLSGNLNKSILFMVAKILGDYVV